jgi:hypothetical protein
MTKISEAETLALSGKNMKDLTRKASTNDAPDHCDTYTQIEPHALSFVSPGLAADVLHDHDGLLASKTPDIKTHESHPMSESVGMHHVK